MTTTVLTPCRLEEWIELASPGEVAIYFCGIRNLSAFQQQLFQTAQKYYRTGVVKLHLQRQWFGPVKYLVVRL